MTNTSYRAGKLTLLYMVFAFAWIGVENFVQRHLLSADAHSPAFSLNADLILGALFVLTTGFVFQILTIKYFTHIEKTNAQKETQLRLAHAVEQAAESIVITNSKGIIEYVNPAFEVITGYAREEVIGKNPSILKSGRHDEIYYKEFWETINSKRTWKGRFINQRKDGSRFEEMATVSPVLNEKDEIQGFVAVKMDVTKESVIEERLRSFQRLEETGRLAGGIAHDFNNLLAVVLNYASFIIEEAPTEGIKEDAREIRKAAERAANLTRQLLIFSRKQIVNQKLTDLNETIPHMQKLLQSTLGEGLHLDLKLTPKLYKVMIDPAQFEQVIMNLVVNARDAMPDGGTLRIQTDNVLIDQIYASTHVAVNPGPYVRITFTDTGCGITKDVMSNIFEPFFTTKEPGKGTGLGLSTVYGIIKMSHGNIWVYSEPNIGTTFKIYLPVAPSGEKIEIVKPEDPPLVFSIPTVGKRVLVVEDDPGVQSVVHRILEKAGFQVIDARNGDQALKALAAAAGKFDLMVTDVIMPGMTGKDLAVLAQGLYKNLHVLFMSGFASEVISARGILPDEYSLLEKPFTESELLQKVSEVINT